MSVFLRALVATLSTATAPAILALSLPSLVSAGEEPTHATVEHRPQHMLGVFLGDTTENRREGVTFGLEYEYRISSALGIGATAERVAGDFDTNVFVLPVALHSGPWKVYAGPGWEHTDEGNEALFRVGVEYGFEAGRYEISPQIDVDFVDGERLFVIGVVFARPF